MCGITGFIDYSSKSNLEDLTRMTLTLNHRGPDNYGVEMVKFKNVTIGFGHTRLSILDLSDAGNQPMVFEEFTIVLNGEIYNYREIKKELLEKGYKFKSDSDTEVVLKSFKEWGKECVNRFIGMFSFVIIDNSIGKVFFFRDRAGVKPLYIYQNGDILLFSSELKSFHKHNSFKKDINHSALYNYMQFGYVTGNECIFNDCYKVAPGSLLTVDLNTRKNEKEYYWELNDYFKKPLFDLTYNEAKSEAKKLLKSACNYRMVSDVPVGVFLSGGYDSSLVTSILQNDSSKRLKTFTIGFPDGVDESKYASEVAKHLNTDHTTFNCTHKEAQDIIPNLPYFYDEPFADISAIPTILVSQIAKKSVTVALSADGGDELFAGYKWYKHFHQRYAQINSIPNFVKPFSSKVLKGLGKSVFVNNENLQHKLLGLSKVLKTKNNNSLIKLIYETRILSEKFNSKLFLNPKFNTPNIFKENYNNLNSEYSGMLSLDYRMNLTDCLLVKVDRATMSTSLEGREPLMDHRLAEFTAQLPMNYKFDGVTHKKILKDITHEYIPKTIMDRPKIGFDLPISDYLQNDLSFLLKEYLSEEALIKSGVFNPSFVLDLVKSFNENKLIYKPVIWRILMFQMWFKKWM